MVSHQLPVQHIVKGKGPEPEGQAVAAMSGGKGQADCASRHTVFDFSKNNLRVSQMAG